MRPADAADAGSVEVAGAAEVAAPQADERCLRALDNAGLVYKRAPGAGGMRTPVEVTGAIGGVALVARGRRSALMDCVLARALFQASDLFGPLGITALTFSAGYDHRTRRGSSELSAHAYGLAIDVHTVRGGFGEYDVRKQFEPGVGTWRGLTKSPEALGACVGEPVTTAGRLLRQLACRLKLHPAFRVIVSPDDDADHQDHLHIEAGSDFFPPHPDAPPLAPPPLPPPAHAAPKTDHPPAAHAAVKSKRRPKRKPPVKKKAKGTKPGRRNSKQSPAVSR